MYKLKNKNILVYGLSRTGQAVLEFLQGKGCNTFVYDDTIEKCGYIQSGANRLSYADFTSKFGALKFDELFYNLKQINLIIASPGVPLNSALLLRAKAHKVKIVGEIEFAYWFCKSSNIIGITGTNGKTTTTELVSHLIKGYRTCFMGGNVGTPFISLVEKIKRTDIVVLELSSFQLETIKKFRAKVSCILNLSPDHLDRYGDVNEYYGAKFNIVKNQKFSDVCILNKDDKIICNRKFKCRAKKKYFSLEDKKVDAYFYDKSFFTNCGRAGSSLVARVEDVTLVGNHNYANILSAILICQQFNLPNNIILDRIKGFKSLPHRLEFVKNIDGVAYYNDSKATNIDACLKALTAFKGEVVRLIVGGSDKGEDFANLFSRLEDNIFCYLYGETCEKMLNSVQDVGYYNYKVHNKLIEALESARSDAKAEDVILLSPACASFDEFQNYKERGEFFKSWVNNYD